MSRVPPKDRPSARDLASGGDPSWECPRCGCRDWRVLDTREAADGSVGRTRYCRYCGKLGPRLYTEERPYRASESSEVPSQDEQQFSPPAIAACRHLGETG